MQMKSRLVSFALVAAIALMFAQRFAVLFYPDPYMIAAVKSDDAYYYCDLVMHYAHNQMASTDGVNLTNGFHPLYFVLLCLGEVTFDFGKMALVRYALAILLVCETVSIFILFLILKEIFASAQKALAATALFMVMPFYQSTILSGVEAAVYQMCAAAALLFYMRSLRKGTPISIHDSFILGILMGITALGRTEAVLLFAAIGAADLINWRAGIKGLVARWAAMAAGAGVMLLPWLIWNYLTFRTIRQDSMIANYLFFSTQRSLFQDVVHYWRMYCLTIVGQFFGTNQNVPLMIQTKSWIMGILFLGLAGSFLVLKKSSMKAWQAQTAFVLLLFLTIHFVFYLWFGNSQTWYFTLPIFATVLLLALMFSNFRARSAGFACLACAIVLVSGYYHYRNANDLMKLGLKLSREGRRWDYLYKVAADGKIGTYNSGAMGYFTELRIVNLDGVVNHAAAEAKINRDLDGFIVKNDVKYIWDTEWFINQYRKYYRDFDKLFKLSPQSPTGKNQPRLYVRTEQKCESTNTKIEPGTRN